MRILIAGGDGFCGWPTALHLSSKGHDVAILDNLARRAIDEELGTESLTPIATLPARVERWQELTGSEIHLEHGDLSDPQVVHDLFSSFNPEAVVHFAEQRSAPYSMIGRQHAVCTQVGNVVGTLNLLFAMHELASDCHLVKLGTMGEYGTPNIDIEEGYIEIEHNGRKDVLPYPKQPGSFYHLSKVHDSHNIYFACRTWGLRATDLNQGIVYNVQTEQTGSDPLLLNRFDYDGVFGTAINRFCVQAATGVPISVYGEGGQTRGFIDIRDTVACIELAIESPPPPGEMRVLNQFTEQWSVMQLAEMVAKVAGEMGVSPSIDHLDNPRVEAESHYYYAKCSKLIDLGLQPHLLEDATITQLLQAAIRHRDRARLETVLPEIDWRSVPYWGSEPAIGRGASKSSAASM